MSRREEAIEAKPEMPTHAILMPLKANRECPPLEWATRYTSSFGAFATTKLYVGVDEDDQKSISDIPVGDEGDRGPI